MMKKVIKGKKVLAALLAAGLVMGALTACGNESGGGSSQGGSSTQSSASADSGQQAENTDGGADSGEVKTLSIFIDHTWYPIDSFTGAIPEEITKRTGITLDVTVAVNAEQLGTMISSGELPDLVFTQKLFDTLSNEKVCYSYEDLISEYNVDWEIPAKQLGIARGYSQDGKAYTVLNLFADTSEWANTQSAPMMGSLSYRRDIYEELGSPAMNNLDDLYNVMGMVKEKYPDMVPLQLNNAWNTEVFKDLVGIGAVRYEEKEDGTYQHYIRDERYKEMLLWLNKCYASGYLSPDDKFFSEASQGFNADGYFFSCGCTQNGITAANGELAEIDPSYVRYEMKPFDTAYYGQSSLGWSGTFISKNCKDPEAAIRFLQQMFTPEMQQLTQMGREGIDFTFDENGFPVYSEEWKASVAADTNKVDYNTWFYLGGSTIIEAEGRVAQMEKEWYEEAYPEIRKRYENLPWIEAARPIGEIDEKIAEDKVSEMVMPYEQKIIQAATPEEAAALYDELITNAEKSGLASVEAYITEHVAELMPLYQ